MNPDKKQVVPQVIGLRGNSRQLGIVMELCAMNIGVDLLQRRVVHTTERYHLCNIYNLFVLKAKGTTGPEVQQPHSSLLRAHEQIEQMNTNELSWLKASPLN